MMAHFLTVFKVWLYNGLIFTRKVYSACIIDYIIIIFL